ncbi:MAG TPA: DUF4286 family protein [Chitinophagaceae bacterium]|nr:DUF4286 family protein [Chitinophagaceae bacterium]
MTDYDNNITDQGHITAATPEGNFIYNVTTQVSWAIHDKWLAWMLDDFIPAVLGTGCFIKHQVVRLLETDETDGPVYAVQYYLQSKALYNNYLLLYQPGFKKLENEQWGDGIFSFSSLMQVVN